MKWLFYRFMYRPLMTLSHRFNWHHTRTIHPEGDTMVMCDWCGLRYVKARAPRRVRTVDGLDMVNWIKKYRAETGSSLYECKAEFERREASPLPQNSPMREGK